jgi:two-component system response regulator TrcR
MNKIKVLLVEDEAVLASIVKETLDARGFELTIAANGV